MKLTFKIGGRAVIYQRVSSKEQEGGFSPETQLEKCYDWAACHNYEVVKPFVGESESAKTDVNRKRFNEMLKFVMDRRNKIDAVIVYSTSRFSRTGTKSFSIVDELMDRGIPVFSATSDYDARTANGKLMQRLELLLAEYDNSIKSQAVRDNGAKALRSGRWIQAPPLGYDMKTTRAKQTITVTAEGRLIQKAFAMKVNENLSNEEIRDKMKILGLDLIKQRWSKIFRNIFYAGYFSHPFLEGDIVKGPYEPLVSLEDFLKINGVVQESHSRGYEIKGEREYAPLLGVIRCPVCGHNLTASLSTKMRKKYGREVGYYMCGRKNCKCNVSTKKANAGFEQLLGCMALPEAYTDALRAQLKKAFPILNQEGAEEITALKTNLAHKETEISRVEYNLATAPTAKVQEICMQHLEKLEAEKEAIQRELADKDKSLLNLDEYIDYALNLKDNILKLWQIASLPQKRSLQNLAFPDGVVWDKENEIIEPLSKNEFLFVYDLKSVNYGEKENGQTADYDNLSALAPPTVEILNIWRDFRKVVDFIDGNREWIVPLLQRFEAEK